MLQDEAFLAGLPKKTTLIDVLYAIAGCELPTAGVPGHGGLNAADMTVEATQASNSLLNT